MAINEAANYALRKNIKNALILTESRSATQKLNDRTINPKNDHITLKTKRLLIEARDAGFEISLAWIPSHSKINGNETVNQLANLGRALNVPKQLDLDIRHVLPCTRQKLKDRENVYIMWERRMP